MRVLIVSEGNHELGGALETLVERLKPRGPVYEWKKVSSPELRVHAGKGPGYFKKALRCVLYAEANAYDAIVFVIDQDDDTSRRRQIDEAQDDLRMTRLPRALGVAVRTFDAWMLADEQALSKVLGVTVQRQPDPESIRDAKAVCQRHHDEANFGEGLTAMYAAVAGRAGPSAIEQRCPLGFAPFASRVRAV